MFEWLEREIGEIKTRRFHVVDGPTPEFLKVAVEESCLSVPLSYKEFIFRFGNATLYKKLGYYLVGVMASPREEISQEGEALYRFGHYDVAYAYFKGSLLQVGGETPVFEGHKGSLREVADGFEAWLKKKCKAARKRYTRSEWARIVVGPAPFTAEEHRIVEARKLFQWRVTGTTADGKLQFEVYNGSDTVLPYLSVGIRRKDGSFQGGVWLPISQISPKRRSLIEQDCYTKLATPGELEAFPLPDPEPEDRERYWEFRPQTGRVAPFPEKP